MAPNLKPKLMSDVWFWVLNAFEGCDELYASDLLTKLNEKGSELHRVGTFTFYQVLHTLQEREWIHESGDREMPSGEYRRLYYLSLQGRRTLEEERQRRVQRGR